MYLDLFKLNDAQRDAVCTTTGPLLVLAGAGSGKTRVITYRIAYLLSMGVSLDSIVAVTFTNKAADEMRHRIEMMVGKSAKNLQIGTFHGFGFRILREEKEALGYPNGFVIYDSADQLALIREIAKDIKLFDRTLDLKAVLSRVSRLKNAGISALAFAEKIKQTKNVSDYDFYTAELYPHYEQRLNNFCALDFDDLLLKTQQLFLQNPAILARWQAKFSHFMVDEYQDTNACQLSMLKLLCEPHRNLAVVGDDDQSIYAFRGAEADNILAFEKHFPGAKIVKLEENYRSTQLILDAANGVIAQNKKRSKKILRSQQDLGEKVQFITCPDEEQEARFVISEIEMLLTRYMASDIAILYRSNTQARFFEEELRQARLPYRMLGGQSLFDRKEVKDAIAYLKLLLYPQDEISLRRVINYPTRGIGIATLEALSSRRTLKENLWQLIEQHSHELSPAAKNSLGAFCTMIKKHQHDLQRGVSVTQVAKNLIEEAGIGDEIIKAGPTATISQRRLRNLDYFFTGLQRQERNQPSRAALLNYLNQLSLQNQTEDEDVSQKEITMATLHGSKGLEFKIVFLVGLEEDLLPHRRTINPQERDLSEALESTDITEERRLFYVGITRARERLYISWAKHRGNRPRIASRFLDDIPESACHKTQMDQARFKLSADEEIQVVDEQLAKLRLLFAEEEV